MIGYEYHMEYDQEVSQAYIGRSTIQGRMPVPDTMSATQHLHGTRVLTSKQTFGLRRRERHWKGLSHLNDDFPPAVTAWSIPRVPG